MGQQGLSWGLVPSTGIPMLWVYDMKETTLRSGNFILYVKKATESISGLIFDVGCTGIVWEVDQNSKIRLGTHHDEKVCDITDAVIC